MRAVTDEMGFFCGGVLGCDETRGNRGLKLIHGVFFGYLYRLSQHKSLGSFANLAFSSEHICVLSHEQTFPFTSTIDYRW